MKKFFLFLSIVFLSRANAQNVGINSLTPQMTLDVNGVASTVTKADGMRAPRITLAQLNAKTGYNSNHVGALLYVTDVTGGSTVSATAQIATVGYYYFDGTAWQSVVAKTGTAVFIASLGNGNGSATAASINSGGFTTVPLSTVTKNVGGGIWTPATNTYTVPSSGTYLIKSSIRLVDGSASRNVFQAVHTVNSDIPEGIWDTNSGNRWTMLYTRIAYFNKNDQLRLYMYSDGATANISDASLNIVLLSQN
ncbi:MULTISPECIES: hypothetical protein [Chryseobacterium]|uniref:C1q domain-containing protein n=1 Tax=Candidatus Chryseobacterium massiliense TaxID=204089 RepID=A0A3D9AVL7_9FLAO|nr:MULTISPECIES: hypothetical protein [Chryseobacterium]REC45379.1 hypothetical protein DRF68_15745 [Candidatus Chryseobacterium massiliae]